MGRNFEQAMLLAIEDVNNAGGIDGVPLSLDTRDSNSGSERGLNDLLSLIYNDGVQYLIGPDENELANDIVSDIKSLNILNILPGYAATSTARVSSSGAWMRLAPSPGAVGCALAGHAVEDGAAQVNTLASPEDYNASLATYFTASFSHFIGTSNAIPSVGLQTGQSSYTDALLKVFSYGATKTLLVAYPETAAAVVTEAAEGPRAVGDRRATESADGAGVGRLLPRADCSCGRRMAVGARFRALATAQSRWEHSSAAGLPRSRRDGRGVRLSRKRGPRDSHQPGRH